MTGFVAATGKSYLCEDTTDDPLYLEGCRGAKSSLTVPLVLHDEVIGTFNVESPEPRAFTESDLQFLEIFTRDVAVGAQYAGAAAGRKGLDGGRKRRGHPQRRGPAGRRHPQRRRQHHGALHRPRARGGRAAATHPPQRPRHQAGDPEGGPEDGPRAGPAGGDCRSTSGRSLRGRRMLVVDADDSVRSAAHNLLERYGCVVETAHDGGEAICMVRNVALDGSYDVIIADIRLPDMSGYDLMVKLQAILDPVPLVLMTGFGYDPGHSIVKARQAGLPAWAVLYKPFRLDQLLTAVEHIIQEPRPVPQT